MHTRTRPHGKVIIFLLSIISALALTAGCAPRAYLIVDYPIPAASDQLHGQKVRLQIMDRRTDKTTLTFPAARQFAGFQDRYSLAWVTENRERILAGEKYLEELYFEAFKKRLERLGAEVVSREEPGVPLMQVLINTFIIDFQDRRWIARMSYEANMTVDNRLVAREMMKGEAERVKIIGRKGADDTLSDIFTTIVNRLDLAKLFQQAGLM